MSENHCDKCKGFTSCLDAVLDNKACKCIHFGELKANVDDVVDKINSVCTLGPLSIEEINALIYHANKR